MRRSDWFSCLAFALCYPALAAADHDESKAVAAAQRWLTAMVDGVGEPPAVTSELPLVFETASTQRACDELRSGTAASAAALAPLRACLVATRKDLGKKAQREISEKPLSDAGHGQRRTLKGVPRVVPTSTIVEAVITGKRKEMNVDLLVDPEGRVRVVWMSWRDAAAGD